MRWTHTVFILAACSAALQTSAAERSAVLSLRRFEFLDQFSGVEESRELNFYLKAVADSLTFANAYLASGGKPKLFCTNDAIDIPQLRDILRRRITYLAKIGKDSEETKNRIGAVTVIIEKLRESYPCR